MLDGHDKNHGADDLECHFGFIINNPYDQPLNSCSAHTKKLRSIKMEGGESKIIRVDIQLNLEPNSYTLSCGLGMVGENREWLKIHGTRLFGVPVVGLCRFMPLSILV